MSSSHDLFEETSRHVLDGIELGVVIPTFNSGAHLETIIKRLVSELNQLNLRYQVLIVDDGSPSNLRCNFLDLVARVENLIVCSLNQNLGQHYATLFGLHALRDIPVLLTIDDDTVISADNLRSALAYLRSSDSQLLILEDQTRHRTFWRELSSSIIRRRVQSIVGRPVKTLSSIRLLRGDVARKLPNPAPSDFISVEILRASSSHMSFSADGIQTLNRPSNYNVYQLLKMSSKIMFRYTTPVPRLAAVLATTMATLMAFAMPFIPLLPISHLDSLIWPPAANGIVLGISFVLFLILALLALTQISILRATMALKHLREQFPISGSVISSQVVKDHHVPAS